MTGGSSPTVVPTRPAAYATATPPAPAAPPSFPRKRESRGRQRRPKRRPLRIPRPAPQRHRQPRPPPVIPAKAGIQRGDIGVPNVAPYASRGPRHSDTASPGRPPSFLRKRESKGATSASQPSPPMHPAACAIATPPAPAAPRHSRESGNPEAQRRLSIPRFPPQRHRQRYGQQGI